MSHHDTDQIQELIQRFQRVENQIIGLKGSLQQTLGTINQLAKRLGDYETANRALNISASLDSIRQKVNRQ